MAAILSRPQCVTRTMNRGNNGIVGDESGILGKNRGNVLAAV